MLAVHIPLGAFIGLSVVIIHEIYVLLTEQYAHFTHENSVFLVIFPVIAILAAYFIVTLLTGAPTGGGSHRLLEVYHYKGGKMTLRSTIFEPLASSVTIGLGGSAGFEGPSLLLGGGLGSYIGQRLKLPTDELSTILICGAAAGVSAIFKAPLTGIMFALEIPYQRDIYREAFIPATIASASSYIVAVTLSGAERVFPILPEFELSSMISLHSLAIGIIAGLLSILFVTLSEKMRVLKTKVKLNGSIIALLGGLAIGVFSLYYPNIAGTGYETIRGLLTGELNRPVSWVVMLLIVKMLATSITLTMGGSGGVFVPTLFVGATLGKLYTLLVPGSGDSSIIIVAAMAAMISASNKTLLTSVALVAETTGPSSVAYTLLASVTSYFLSGNTSFYGHVQPEKELLEEEEGLHTIFHHLETEHHELLNGVKVKDLLRYDSLTLDPDMSPKDAINRVSSYPFSVYPLVSKGKLVGSITLEDILFMYDNDVPKIDVPNPTPLTAEMNESLRELIDSLIEGEFDCVFVVDGDSHEYRGFISETDITLKLLELLKQTMNEAKVTYKK